MRIKKQNQQSVSAAQSDVVNKGQSVLNDASSDVRKRREEAIEYIHSAINALGDVANEDKISKDSIANLSVVLLDLTAESAVGVKCSEEISKEDVSASPSGSTKVRLPRIVFDRFDDAGGIRDVTESVEYCLQDIERNPSDVIYRVETPDRHTLKQLIEKDPTIVTKLVKKFKAYAKDFLEGYVFDKERAVRVLLSAIRNKPELYVKDNSDSATSYNRVKQVLEQALKEYVNSVDIDTAYDKLLSCWDYPSRNPITIEQYEHALPEEVGKPAHSGVSNSSFSTYYYYKVVVDLAGDKVEFIDTVSDYYSGGWN